MIGVFKNSKGSKSSWFPEFTSEKGNAMRATDCLGGGIPGGIGFGGGMFGTPKFLTSDGRPRQKPPCKFWPQGHCSKGSLCPFEHVNGPPAPGMALGGKGNDGKSQTKGNGHLNFAQTLVVYIVLKYWVFHSNAVLNYYICSDFVRTPFQHELSLH